MLGRAKPKFKINPGHPFSLSLFLTPELFLTSDLLQLVERTNRQELELEAESTVKEANLASVNTDDENDEEEYEAWQVRELKRIKRDREQREQ